MDVVELGLEVFDVEDDCVPVDGGLLGGGWDLLAGWFDVLLLLLGVGVREQAAEHLLWGDERVQGRLC